MSVGLNVLVDVTTDAGTSMSYLGTTCVLGCASGTTSSWRASAAFVRVTRRVGTRPIYPKDVEAWRNRWSLFEDGAQPSIGDAAS